MISSAVTGFSKTVTNSVNEPVGTGTRCAAPSNFPFNSGITNPIALAAPVVLGTMLTAAARARRKSPFGCGASNVFCNRGLLSLNLQRYRIYRLML